MTRLRCIFKGQGVLKGNENIQKKTGAFICVDKDHLISRWDILSNDLKRVGVIY